MIRFVGSRPDGRPVLGFGLSRVNCERLLKGEPITLSLSDMGVEAELYLFAGEDELAMAKDAAVNLDSEGAVVRVERGGTHPQRESPEIVRQPRPKPGDN